MQWPLSIGLWCPFNYGKATDHLKTKCVQCPILLFRKMSESINRTLKTLNYLLYESIWNSPDAIDRSLEIYAFISPERRESLLNEYAISMNIYILPTIDLISTLNYPKLNLCIHCMHERNRMRERETEEDRESETKIWTIWFFFLLASKHQCIWISKIGQVHVLHDKYLIRRL